MKKTIAMLVVLLTLSGCSSIADAVLPDIPNPLAEEKGIKANVQLGKTNTQIEKKQLAEVTTTVGPINTNSTVNETSKYEAEEVQIVNSNTETYMIVLLCLFAGMAIPTRGQYMQIKMLKETIKHERTESEKLRQEARQA